MSQLKIKTKHICIGINLKTSQCIGELYRQMSKIIENRGSVKVEYRNHAFEKCTDHYAELQRLAVERGITINEAVNRLIDFILAGIGDNDIIHY